MAKKYFSDGNGLRVAYDGMPELRRALEKLAGREVLVGVPESKTERDDPDSKAAGITNASLAYIHDNGAPEARIPARPFMIPGIERMLPFATDTLAQAARYGLAGEPQKVEDGFDRVGLAAVSAIQSTIREGIPPPLADATVRARAKKGRAGAQPELNRRAAGYGASLQLAKPLIDTSNMIKSITYVVRNRNQRG